MKRRSFLQRLVLVPVMAAVATDLMFGQSMSLDPNDIYWTTAGLKAKDTFPLEPNGWFFIDFSDTKYLLNKRT